MTEHSAGDLTAAERAELTALRAEVAELRRGSGRSPATGRGRRTRIWRWVACGLLFAMAGLLALGGVTARYVRGQLLDTDRYVQTVSPIGQDPAVQAQIADTASTAIIDALGLEQVTADALDALVGAAPDLPPLVAQTLPGLAPAIAGGAEGLIRREVTKAIQSERFETVWVEANRIAHRNLVTVLTGEGDTAVRATDRGEVQISLAPIIDEAKKALLDQGLTIVERLPRIDVTFTVFQSNDVIKYQRYVKLLDDVADALPFVALAVGVLGVLAAPRGRRRKAIAVFGVVIAVAMELLVLGLNVGRSVYLNAILDSGAAVTMSAATGVFDPIVEPLRWTLRAVMAFGIAVAFAGYITGDSRSAVTIRRWTSSLSSRVHGDRTATGTERWIGRHRAVLQLAVVVVAGVAIALWNYPSGAVVGWIAAVAGLVCLVIYLVGAPVREPASEEGEGSAPDGEPVAAAASTGSTDSTPDESTRG